MYGWGTHACFGSYYIHTTLHATLEKVYDGRPLFITFHSPALFSSIGRYVSCSPCMEQIPSLLGYCRAERTGSIQSRPVWGHRVSIIWYEPGRAATAGNNATLAGTVKHSQLILHFKTQHTVSLFFKTKLKGLSVRESVNTLNSDSRIWSISINTFRCVTWFCRCELFGFSLTWHHSRWCDA